MSKPLTESEKAANAVLSVLATAGKLRVPSDAISFNGSAIVLPETFAGPGGIRKAVDYLVKYEQDQEKYYRQSREFKFRAWDGANAFNLAMKHVFGTAGLGVTTVTMFGENPPQLHTIPTGVGSTTQVPWGQVQLDQLDCTFTLDTTYHQDYGAVFVLHAKAPKKFRGHIEVFFDVVENFLKTQSIYRGKAIDGGDVPNFIDTSKVDESRVVYSRETLRQLDANLYSLVKYADEHRKNKLPLKRSVLLEGPYGTGKTLAGMLAAKQCEASGWTFILCRPGKDDLNEVLQTAQLYAPSVVWYEDIDVVAGGNMQSDMQVSKILDALDSVTTKGTEVLAGFTTNHIGKIQKGVLRPGRLDAVIHIGHLDPEGFEKLVKLTIPRDKLDANVDFQAVSEAMTGMLPAFVTEACQRAVRYNIAANGGRATKIGTADLVDAAKGLRPQLELMEGAQEGTKQLDGVDASLAALLERQRVGDRFDVVVKK
jgi:transitional endoplasmic reticulum ATPase